MAHRTITLQKIFFIGVLLSVGFVALFPDSALAADSGIIAKIVKAYADKSQTYLTVMTKYAKNLFFLCVTLEIAWLGVKAALGHNDIGETVKNFCITLVVCGVFLAIINNYYAWTKAVIHGLSGIAGEAGGVHDSSDFAFQKGMELCHTMWNRIETFGMGQIGMAFIYVLCLLGVLICFCLITARVIVIKCEAFVAMAAASILVGFGGSSIFRDFAVSTLKYILSVGMKIFTMQLIINIGYQFMAELLTGDASLEQAWIVLGSVIVLYVLISTLPSTVANLVTGSNGGSGTGLGAVGRMGMAAGGMALGAAAATVAGGMNVARAHQVARQSQGGTNPVSTMGALWNARNEAKNNRFHGARSEAETTIGGILKTQMAMGNMPKADTSTTPRAQVATGSTSAPAGPQAAMGSTTNAGSATAPTAPKAQAATGGASNTLKKS